MNISLASVSIPIVYAIFIIAIGVISSAVKNKKKKKQKAPKQNQSYEAMMKQRQVKAANNTPRKEYPKKKKISDPSWASLFEEAPSKSEASNILERANQNVNEDFENKKESLLNTETVDSNMNKSTLYAASFEDDEDLMQKVNDLIVMGADTSAMFTRDFVAEGEEIISRALQKE